MDKIIFKIARPKLPIWIKVAVSREKVLNVLNPPQKPIISNGCSHGLSNFFTSKKVNMATNNEAKKLETKVAIGNWKTNLAA